MTFQVGFAKVDITPRLGVQLRGYGPFLNRYSRAVRERLYARALAASDGDRTLILLSCDLTGIMDALVWRTRELVQAETGIPADHICVHAIHSHSCPSTHTGYGWGDMDPPYVELLPQKLASACVLAAGSTRPAALRHAVLPCVGIGYNREAEERPALETALDEAWRPAHPEITHTEAHVLCLDAGNRMMGFLSYFSCHPVVGSGDSRYIHSDFVGLATNWLERQFPGTTGLFLQGCHGNINSCVAHESEQESLLALDVLAGRYARQIAPGLTHAEPLDAAPVRALSRSVSVPRQPLSHSELREMLAQQMSILTNPQASDADRQVRMATVYALAIRNELRRLAAAESFPDQAEIQALRLGDIVIVGAPFELMNRYRTRVQAGFPTPVLVASLCNGAMGYAPEKESFAKKDNYAARITPYILGYPPLSASVEDVLVDEMSALVAEILQS